MTARTISVASPPVDLMVTPLDSSTVIEFLQQTDLGHEKRRKLIIEAEVLPSKGQQGVALARLLRQFIEDCRASNVRADLITVGSAIRNYIAIAPIGEAFAVAASLLKADRTFPVPIVLEVEVTKMVVRKLTANPPAERDQYPELATRLEQLVYDYAKPRFLAREKHGTVALSAILGLVLTRSGRDAWVVDRVWAVGVPWFRQLLGRRAAQLRSDLAIGDSKDMAQNNFPFS
jgi:hypothetical protein